MIDPIIQFFEKLITQFSWRRLIFILVVIFISIGVLAWYETYTGHFRFNKIERTTKLLTQLTELSDKIKKENNSKLTNIFEGITNDLNMYVNHSVTAFSLHPAILKAMASAAPWILMLFGFLLTPTPKAAIFGILVAAIPFTIIGAFLPNFSYPWVNYFLYPVGHFFLIVTLVTIWQKRKKRP
jgi:hypothetical protein